MELTRLEFQIRVNESNYPDTAEAYTFTGCWNNRSLPWPPVWEQRGNEAYEASAGESSEASDRTEQLSKEDMYFMLISIYYTIFSP